MTWFAVGAAIVAAGATYANNQHALRKQNKITTNAILARNKARDDQAALIKSAADKIGQNNAKKPIAAATQSYLSDLQNANTSNEQIAPATGAMSSAYQQAAGAANANVADKARTSAGLMAITDAPGIQRQGEQSLIGQLGLDLNGITGSANDATYLSQMKARGVQPNPWVALAASALSSYAAGRGAGGAGAGTTASGSGAPYTGYGNVSDDYSGNVAGLYGKTGSI